ncbi:hypothetical protein RB595_003422 [Gaeumannomyces hyphopodioides]
MKSETFAAFLISVALPTLAYPAGSSIAGLDADAAIEQRDPKLPARPYRHPSLTPAWSGPVPIIGDKMRAFPKVASRSDGAADVERREPRRGKGKGNNQQPAGPGKVETVTNVLNTAFPWVEMVNNQQQPKRSVDAAEVEKREPKRGKGKGNNNNNQQPGGPGKVETVTNVLNTAFPWVEMVNNQQQPKRSVDAAEVEKREPKRGKGKGNGQPQPGGPGKVETVTNVLNTAFPWVDMINQQQQGKRSEASIEQRAPKGPKGPKGRPNNNQQPGGPGKVETVTNVLNTAFPWVDMINQQQQGKRSEASIEQRAPKGPKGPKGRPNNNQQPGGPGKVETVTNVLNTAFPWVDMINQQQQGKRSEASIEQRAPKGPKGPKGRPNNNQQPGGPGKVETVTNVLNTAFPWVDMINQQQQGKRSEAGIEQRAPKGPKGKPNNNNNQQPGGPGKVETVTNVLNTAFPWVNMFNQQQPQKRSEAPSDAEIADMLEAATAGYLNERQAQVVRRAVVAAILA